VLDAAEVRSLSLWATENLLPDVTILLDLDESLARQRLTSADKVFDRLESEKSEFHERVRSGFLAMAAAEPERFLVLNAAASVEELAASIQARIEPLLT